MWGGKAGYELIRDELSEWLYVDSADYSIPYYPTTSLDLQDVIKSRALLISWRFQGELVEVEALVKYYLTEFIKNSSR
jgi:hypothetical protein